MLKELNEKRGALVLEMNGIVNKAKTENRTVTPEERAHFDELSAEVDSIDGTIECEQRAESLLGAENAKTEQPRTEKRAAREIVADMVRLREVRSGENTISSTGNIVPIEFSTDIIKNVTELCGIMQRITVVNSKGVYKQIIAGSNRITAGWTDEIGEITASTADFTTVEIGHHKLTSLVKMSLELINQNEFDIVGEFVSQMNLDFARKAEAAIIGGNGTLKPYGLTTSGTAYTLAAPAISSDDIVKIFHTLKAPFQPDAAWVMSNDTLCKIRLLKDSDGRYMFHQNELTGGYVGTILGKPVLISECMDNIAAGKAPILFGDYKRGYKANLNPNMTLQVLNEKFAEYGVRGILGILWLDGRPVNPEAYVTVRVDE